MYCYKRKEQENLHRHEKNVENTASTGGSDMTTEAQTGVMQHQVKDCWKPSKAKEAKNGFSPKASGGSTALPTP